MTLLCLANPHTMNLAWELPEYREALARPEVVLVNDGVGIRIASLMRGVRMRDSFAGTDLMPRLFGDQPWECTAFYYGAKEENNRRAVEKMSARYPNVKIVGRIHGYVDPEREALPLIRESGADILMCALGQPRQELFMSRYRDELGVKVGVSCGAMFDFWSGAVRRAPRAFRALRCEWVFRLLLEPRRMARRYVVGNPLFLIRALRSRPTDLSLMRQARAEEGGATG